jgi:hypothetical protein
MRTTKQVEITSKFTNVEQIAVSGGQGKWPEDVGSKSVTV